MPHSLLSVDDTAGTVPVRRACDAYLAPDAPLPVPDDGSIAAHAANQLASSGAAAATGGLQPGVKALLQFHDGSVIVLQPGTTLFTVGSMSIPAFSRLEPPDCRKMIERRHLEFSYHDGVVAVISCAGSCGRPWGPFILRGSATMPLLHGQPAPLLDADTVFLALYLGRGVGSIRVAFSSEPAATPRTDDSSRVPALQRALRACASERDRFRRDSSSLSLALAEAESLLYPALARTADALERRRVREDGIICGCCGALRLPDFFFPSILGAGVPPAERRCVFCIQHVRQHHDLYGPPFHLPSGFTMPSPHPEDFVRLTELVRCSSCARMRHRTMFHSKRVERGMPRGATAYVAVARAPSVIHAAVRRDAPRCHASLPICVFCRHTLATAKAAAASDATSDASSSAAPALHEPADVRSSTQWSPDADEPGDAASDCYSSDGMDPPDDPFDLGDFARALG